MEPEALLSELTPPWENTYERIDPQMIDQTFFDDAPLPSSVKYATEKHVACVFLLDTSYSMRQNGAIDKLNEGLRAFKAQTLNDLDSHAKACIDVAIVSFSSTVDLIQDFCPVEDMQTPVLDAYGKTAMGGALELGMDMITRQKQVYDNSGTPYFRPWIFCITDGGPNDDYLDAIRRLKWMEQEKKVLAFCVGVEGCSFDIMKDIFAHERIFMLDNLDFTGLFKFVSSSLTALRNSTGLTDSIQVQKPDNMISIPL